MRKLLLFCVLLAGCSVPANEIPQEKVLSKLPPNSNVIGVWGNSDDLWIEFEATFSTEVCHCVMHRKSPGTNYATESMILLDKKPRPAESVPEN